MNIYIITYSISRVYCHTINVVYQTWCKQGNEPYNYDVTITKRHYVYDVIAK